MVIEIYCSLIVVTFIALCLYERYALKSNRKKGKPYELAKDGDLTKMVLACSVWPIVWIFAILEIFNSSFKRFINGSE